MTVRLQLGQSIVLADGITLYADVVLPARVEPAPTLVTLTPYTTDFCLTEALRFASAGFAVVVVDVRGRGGSEGDFVLYDDASDGAECVGWAAMQSWSTGAVGLFGGSYSGLNQWQIAALRPPALRALAPAVAPMPGFDTEFYNGLFNLNNLRWAAFIRGRRSWANLYGAESYWRERFLQHYLAGAAPEALPTLTGTVDPTVALMVARRDDAAFWARRVPTPEQFAAIDVPVLSITGTADNAQRGALEYHRRHLRARPDARHWLVVGPWTHGGERHPAASAAAEDSADRRQLADAEFSLLCQFFRWALSAERDPVPQGPVPFEDLVTVYVQETERWRGFSALPGTPLRLSLASAQDRASGEGSRHSLRLSAAEQRDTAPTLFATEASSWFAVLGGEQADAAWPYAAALPGALTLPLRHVERGSPMTLCGRPRACLRLRLDGRSVDLAVLLAERTEAGQHLTLSSDMLRLSSREPVGWQDIELTGFRFCARRLAPGSVLLLRIVILSTPEFQLPSDGLVDRALSIELADSWLELPCEEGASL